MWEAVGDDDRESVEAELRVRLDACLCHGLPERQ
jgi:hypothetical protein